MSCPYVLRWHLPVYHLRVLSPFSLFPLPSIITVSTTSSNLSSDYHLPHHPCAFLTTLGMYGMLLTCQLTFKSIKFSLLMLCPKHAAQPESQMLSYQGLRGSSLCDYVACILLHEFWLPRMNVWYTCHCASWLLRKVFLALWAGSSILTALEIIYSHKHWPVRPALKEVKCFLTNHLIRWDRKMSGCFMEG